MSALASIRDAALVARFEVLRAIRSWRALGLVVLYIVATGFGTYVFVQVVGQLETALAESLGVPTTAYPGAMLDRLTENDHFRRAVAHLVGDAALVDEVLSYPVMAIFHMWEGLILVPFLASFLSAEAISGDMRSRALRFELVRTGRLELVTGRFIGQALLAGLATFAGISGTLVVVAFTMVGVEPLVLTGALLWLSFRIWAFSLPFIGFGVAMSQWTDSVHLARIFAIIGTAGSWILFGVARWGLKGDWAPLWDIVLQVLPQTWIHGLWTSAPGWMLSSLVCAALGLAAVMLGYARFARRDV